MEMQTVSVRTASPYSVHIGEGLLQRIGEMTRHVSAAEKACIITDANVDSLYAEEVSRALSASGFEVKKIVLPFGEKSKTLKTMEEIYSFLAQNSFTRTDILVALGGGVVGDITGFAAASWLRGVGFVQIPTTLLAAVDSSVGGKTGVNIPAGKNLVGAFWQPLAVVCDPDVFTTLPDEIMADGTAEVIKTACIRDRALFELLASGGLRSHIGAVVRRCVEIKSAVVSEDERDQGVRQILNFGHTLGHAIEKYTHYATLHGHGVAAGMMLITEASTRAGLTAPGVTGAIGDCLRQYGLPDGCDIPLPTLCDNAREDKKRTGSKITLIYLPELGKGELLPMEASRFPDFICGG